jgi:hemoglobin
LPNKKSTQILVRQTMKDIENRIDIELLVNTFYKKVHKDERLAPVFKMSEEYWLMHLQRTYNFWENWLFQTGSYNGGMMWVHLQKNETHPLTTALFERWLAHWFMATDELFAGERASFVKNKALEIGQIMNARMQYQNKEVQNPIENTL